MAPRAIVAAARCRRVYRVRAFTGEPPFFERRRCAAGEAPPSVSTPTSVVGSAAGRHRTFGRRTSDVGPISGVGSLPAAAAGASAAAEGAVDAGDQRLVVEGLSQVLDGAGGARALLRCRVVACGDEDDRDVPPAGDEPLVELEPAEPAQVHVQDETPGRCWIRRRQEILRRRERLDAEAAGPEQPLERSQQRRIVVDDTDDWWMLLPCGGGELAGDRAHADTVLSLRFIRVRPDVTFVTLREAPRVRL